MSEEKKTVNEEIREVVMTVCPKTAEEKPSGQEAVVLSPEEAKIHEVLLKAQQALDEAIGMLGTRKDIDLPF